MSVQIFNGRGRRARTLNTTPTGSWALRLFMRWFARAR